MANSIDYHVKSIGRKLLKLKKLSKTDQETIDEVLDTDIPLIQKLLKNEHKAKTNS